MKPLKLLLPVVVLGTLAGIYWQAQRPAAPRISSTPAPSVPQERTALSSPAPAPAPPAATPADGAPTAAVEVPPPASASAGPAMAVQDTSTRGARLTIPAGAPIPELFPFQAERDTLQQLASTYDRAQIPAIISYLRHADARVRDTAINSLVQIGDASAVPYLEAAAAQTTEPEEKKRLQEAVTFLQLPSFLDVVAFAKPAQAQP